MVEFRRDQLQVLLNAAPDEFTGFSTISGDGICLNRALDSMSAEQRQLLVAVMEHGNKLKAAKAMCGADTAQINTAARNICAALRQLKVQFLREAEAFTPEL